MNVKELKQIIPHMMKTKTPLLAIGHHGVGKSSVFRQIAKEHGMKYFDFRLGTVQDPGDVIGLLTFELNEKGEKVAVKHVPPTWWPKQGEKTLVFFDELNRARRDMLQMIFQMVLDYRLYTHEVPGEVYFASAINPPTNDYVVTDISDKALLSRFCQIKFTPTHGEFLDYLRSTGEHDPDYINFLSEKENMALIDAASNKPFQLEVEADRRAAERVGKLVADGLPEKYWAEVFGGMVGIEVAVPLQEYYKNNRTKPLSGEEVLDSYTSIKGKVKEFESKQREDLITTSTQNFLSVFTKSGEITPAQVANIKAYMLEIPKDMAFGLIKQVHEKHSEFKTPKNMTIFCDSVIDEDFLNYFNN
jgi:hypothetical protein